MRDQFHDPAHAHLYALLEGQEEVKTFAKHAELDVAKAETLPAGAFAWPSKRMYPVNTPENTVLSVMYRDKSASAVPPEVDAALSTACEIYGVNDLLSRARVVGAARHQEKIASVQDDAVWILPGLKRLRVKTASDLQQAETLLLKQYNKLALNDRVEGFVNLVKTARDLGVTLHPLTHRMAGMTVCTAEKTAELIEGRRCAVKDPLFKQAYSRLGGAFRERGGIIRDREELVKAASALATIDSNAGIAHQYGTTIPDPMLTVFSEKQAEDVVNLDGSEIPLTTLLGLPVTFWEDLLGPEISAEIAPDGAVDPQKLQEVLPTLPLDLRIALKAQLPS